MKSDQELIKEIQRELAPGSSLDRQIGELGLRLEAACAHLADITGEITPEEVLATIFETFCIGK